MKKISLRFSLGSALVGAVILTGSLLGLASYISMSTILRDSLRNRMGELVRTASISLDIQAHALLKTEADMESDAYTSLRATLLRVQSMSPDIRFLYTFRKVRDGVLSFVLDSGVPGEDFSPLGEEYTDMTPELAAVFAPPYASRVDTQFYTDDYGTWLSAYAPLMAADGSLEAVLGLDMSAQKIIESERGLLFIIIVVTVGITLFMVIAGFVFSRTISRPLLALSQDMEKIQEFKLDGSVSIRTNLSEVIVMKTALENMKSGLRSFKKYVPSDLVADLISMNKEAILGTEKRMLTLFFSDMENFTTISETMNADRLARFLERYFDVVTSTLERHGATVDKFIGDAVMAFWNAPRHMEDHALRACQAALAIKDKLEGLGAELAQEGYPAINTRIGLNSGVCIVGNIGDSTRMSYTAMGDAVNLASRLESLNKYYGTGILAGEETMAGVGAKLLSRPVDRVAVKGKTKATLISEVLAASEPWLDDYRAGWEAYCRKEWALAASIFEDVARKKPGDGPSTLLARRCGKFVAEGVPSDWTGAWIMQAK